MQMYDASNFSDALNSKNLVLACFISKTHENSTKFLQIFEKNAGMTGIDFVVVDVTDETSPLRQEHQITKLPAIRAFRERQMVYGLDGHSQKGLEEKHIYAVLAKTVGAII